MRISKYLHPLDTQSIAMAVFGHLKQPMSNRFFPDNYLLLLALQRIAHVSISPNRHIDLYSKY